MDGWQLLKCYPTVASVWKNRGDPKRHTVIAITENKRSSKMIEEMQTQHQEKTYLWSLVASYQARTHGWQNSTGNCSPAHTLQSTKAE